MDLRNLVCAFAAIFALGSFFFAVLLLRTALVIRSKRGERREEFGFEFGSAMFFTVFGVLQITLVLMLLVGPWRTPPAPVFPLRIIDLSIPPSPLDRLPRSWG